MTEEYHSKTPAHETQRLFLHWFAIFLETQLVICCAEPTTRSAGSVPPPRSPSAPSSEGSFRPSLPAPAADPAAQAPSPQSRAAGRTGAGSGASTSDLSAAISQRRSAPLPSAPGGLWAPHGGGRGRAGVTAPATPRPPPWGEPMAAHRCPFSSLPRGGAGGSACAVGPAAAESLGAREARSGAAVGVTCPADALGVAAALGRCLPALAMAPAEILSGKIVSAYVTRGGLPARPLFVPAERPALWSAARGFPSGGESLWGAAVGNETGAAGGLGVPRGTEPCWPGEWGCGGLCSGSAGTKQVWRHPKAFSLRCIQSLRLPDWEELLNGGGIKALQENLKCCRGCIAPQKPSGASALGLSGRVQHQPCRAACDRSLSIFALRWAPRQVWNGQLTYSFCVFMRCSWDALRAGVGNLSVLWVRSLCSYCTGIGHPFLKQNKLIHVLDNVMMNAHGSPTLWKVCQTLEEKASFCFLAFTQLASPEYRWPCVVSF